MFIQTKFSPFAAGFAAALGAAGAALGAVAGAAAFGGCFGASFFGSGLPFGAMADDFFFVCRKLSTENFS
jgi:hypothetical protein